MLLPGGGQTVVGPARRVLLANAELGEDLAQEIIGRELSSDLPQRLLGLSQIFGQQIERRQGRGKLLLRVGQARLDRLQSVEVTLTRDKESFGARLPAHRFEQSLPQALEPFAGLG
jgi:hypothetical protein